MADPDPKDLEVFNPAYCEKMRAMGKEAAQSGAKNVVPGIRDKASFEALIDKALKKFPRAEEWIVRRYGVCLAEGFYGGNVPFDTGTGGGSSSTLLAVGGMGVLAAVGWWVLKGKK